MGINIWTGISGTGKTQRMFDEINAITSEAPLGSSIYIITPTQNTLRYENIITNPTGENPSVGSLRTAVFSFSRLMWHIFNETGHSTRDALSESGHIMLLHKMMNEMKSEFEFYRDSAQYIKFSGKVLDMLSEFRAYRVSPDDFGRIETPSGRIRDKMHDLEIIYRNWEKRITELQIEDINLADQFINLLYSDTPIRSLEDAVIYIDGFHNFTESEFALIQALETRVREINLLLTHQGTNKQLFRKTDSVIERLRYHMGDHRLSFEHFGEDFRRSSRNGLIQVERYFDRNESIYDYDGVIFTEAPNVLEEVNDVAREIESLVFDGKAQYTDIGVLYRDANYEPVLQSVFRRYGISYHIDQKVPMHSHPFIQFIMSLLECYMRNYEFGAFMNVLKTGYLCEASKRHYIDQLENFVLERGLSGASLFDDEQFRYHTEVTDEGIRRVDKSDAYAGMIDFKNEVLEKLEKIFREFRKEGTVRDYINTIYDFIVDEGIIDVLAEEMQALDERNEIQVRDETEQAYNMFIRLLDDAYTVFDDEQVPFTLFYETFIDGLKNAEFSLLPSTIDQVMVGSLDLSKVENKKYIFIIGLNRDVMPRESRNTEIISDEEKTVFEHADIELSPSSRTLAQDERFVFYLGVTRATEGLYLSWAGTLPSGEATKISPFLEELLPGEARVKNYEYRRTSEYDRFNPSRLITSIESMEPLLHLKVREMMTAPVRTPEAFLELPEYRGWIEAYHILMKERWHDVYPRLKRNLTYDNRAEPLTREAAEALYTPEMNASVSRFESFFRCPFQHFSRYGLKLKVRKPYQVAPLELGNLYHEVLYDVVKSLDYTLRHPEEKVRGQVAESIERFSQAIQFGIFEHTGYYKSLKSRARDAIIKLLLFMKDIESLGHYRIADVELSFGFRDSPMEEVTLTSNDGYKIHLRGKIDRVDMYETKDGAYVNLIDYKSSTRSISREGVLNGLELQMMTYMHVLMDQGREHFGKEKIMPNSMLFFPVRDPLLSLDDEAALEAAEAEHKKRMRPDGVFINEHTEYDAQLDETSIGISGMLADLDDFKEYNRYLPISVSKNGKINARTKGKYFSPELFRHYADHIMDMYREATDEIYGGEVLASPMATDAGNTRLACEMCDFKSACHIDALMNRRDIRKNELDEEAVSLFESEVSIDGPVDR
ncbi:PD-(D/E)XK nuclease family protein [Salinicoccus roseus]|uniref:PD-(D/E)XK nuclease family protein n=1 Tax=Salinicoccus roseus TaxID=45670 RepID=UPI001EF4FF80|nr:PD-(D/E)XK nuclease family protein [Salinicoccus roseus]MCG7331752.1 PD-(D/E)XK nuclease family protein [Salinicoccus roseus]